MQLQYVGKSQCKLCYSLRFSSKFYLFLHLSGNRPTPGPGPAPRGQAPEGPHGEPGEGDALHAGEKENYNDWKWSLLQK